MGIRKAVHGLCLKVVLGVRLAAKLGLDVEDSSVMSGMSLQRKYLLE
jgi:hypothetical protein